ncbi:hypothetical protein [Methylobacterium sp. WL120]|uniref:hypothetical protein n=1 Tax=Methylobacterium sp. WL120 TaxID=2603887 RepID=UPI0016508A38|nr:hypothetical protein [Methylobacterium sp. WL120]
MKLIVATGDSLIRSPMNDRFLDRGEATSTADLGRKQPVYAVTAAASGGYAGWKS